MIDIKCPKCGNYKYDCFRTEYSKLTENVWADCYCKNCESYFYIKYEATEIELIGDIFDCEYGEVEARAEWAFNNFSKKYDIALGLWKYDEELDRSVKVDLDKYDIVLRRCHSKHCNKNCVYLNRNECDGKWMANNCTKMNMPTTLCFVWDAS